MKKSIKLLSIVFIGLVSSMVAVRDKELADLPNTDKYNVRIVNNAQGDIKVSVTPTSGSIQTTTIPKGDKGYVVLHGCIKRDNSIKVEGLSGPIKDKVLKDYSLSTNWALKWMMDCRWGGLYIYVTNKADGTIQINKITDKNGKNII